MQVRAAVVRRLTCLLILSEVAVSFIGNGYNSCRSFRRSYTGLYDREIDGDDDERTSSYEKSDSSTKGIVSSLTGIVNLVMGTNNEKYDVPLKMLPPPPSTPMELMEKIRDDYTINNYLWTGDIFIPAFDPNCRFTDPTLSFSGVETFVSNVQNLRPIVDTLIEPGGVCRSDLLDIDLNKEKQYVQTRWRMLGELKALPWKPRIDVIGRTKFWYKEKLDGVQVYFYDECWELPAGKALLQLITPGGTIPNSSSS